MNIYSNLKYCVYLTIYSGSKLPLFYIGSTSVKKIESGYRGSVASIKYSSIWKEELQSNPHLFKTKIIKLFAVRKDATICENRLQKALKVVTSSMYINQSYACVNGFAGMDVSKELNPNFGKKWSYDQKLLASINNPMRGKFSGIHKETGKRKVVASGNTEYYGNNKNNRRKAFWNKNKVVVKDETNATFRVDTTDPRYVNGDLRHHTTGTKTVINKLTNKKERLSLDEINPDIHLGNNINRMHFKDKFGNSVNAFKDDPRVISGELTAFSSGRVTVKDNDGNTFSVFKDDPRYINGELVHHTKGTKNAYDALTGSSLGRISMTDPRWKSGDIITVRRRNP
jgi:hypothetical protein